MRTTHTYAILEVSSSAYAEIKGKLVSAGYSDQLIEEDGQVLVNMQGIALAEEKSEPNPS